MLIALSGGAALFLAYCFDVLISSITLSFSLVLSDAKEPTRPQLLTKSYFLNEYRQ